MPDDAGDDAADAAADDVAGAPDAAVVIRVVRSGGIAGTRRAWLLVSQQDSAWAETIDACPWGDEPATTTPDRLVWRVRVSAPPPAREATVPEAALEGPWRELVERVRAEGDAVRPPEAAS